MSKPENVTCPECEGPMTPRTSAHGKFWGCKAYPKCRGTRDSMGGSKKDRDAARDDAEEGSMDGPHHFGRWDR